MLAVPLLAAVLSLADSLRKVFDLFYEGTDATVAFSIMSLVLVVLSVGYAVHVFNAHTVTPHPLGGDRKVLHHARSVRYGALVTAGIVTGAWGIAAGHEPSGDLRIVAQSLPDLKDWMLSLTLVNRGKSTRVLKELHVECRNHYYMSFASAAHPADQGDAATLVDSLLRTQVNLVRAGLEVEVEEAVADKGYHKSETLAECAEWGVRTYIPEPKRKKRTWADKPDSWRVATAANRRRVKGDRSKRLQKKRSERVERSFAHVCATGGARRTWLRGRVNVTKRYLVQVAAFNLGVVMRSLFGVGKPRVLQGAAGTAFALVLWRWTVLGGWIERWYGPWAREATPSSGNFSDR